MTRHVTAKVSVPKLEQLPLTNVGPYVYVSNAH